MTTIPRKDEFIFQAVDFVSEEDPNLKRLYSSKMIFSVLDKYFCIPPNAEFDFELSRIFLNERNKTAKRFSSKNIKFKLKECLYDLFTAGAVDAANAIVKNEHIDWIKIIIYALMCIIKGFYYKFNDDYCYYILRCLYDLQEKYITNEELIDRIIKNNEWNDTENIKKKISESITLLDDLGCINIIGSKIYLQEVIVYGV